MVTVQITTSGNPELPILIRFFRDGVISDVYQIKSLTAKYTKMIENRLAVKG